MKLFKYRILLVEDEAPIRQTAKAILDAEGFEVIGAEDGLEALRCLAGPIPELMITDLRMPKMSGFELLAVVRRRFPQLPTMAVSGEYFTTSVPEGLLADAFLQKGHYSVGDYLAKVRDLLSHPPHRPFPGTQTASAIWVPLRGQGEVVVTCPQCLRSYEVDARGAGLGTHGTECGFCLNCFDFNVDEINLEAVRKSKPSARKKSAQ